jgi:seryl-tRNA synthetase
MRMNKPSGEKIPGSSAGNDKNSGMGNESAEVGNMDKIRDILFGNQAKDYEKRFATMEKRLAQEAGELKEELLKRIDALEIYTKQEIKDINARIKKESNERGDAHKKIQDELKQEVESLNKKIIEGEENLSKKSTELRDQILAQSKQLSEEILSRYDNASKNMKHTAQELDDAKVNRSDLSGFFLELAMRLSNEGNTGSVNNLEG